MSAPQSRYKTINPATGKVEKVFPETTDAEVTAALDKAHTAYGEWSTRPIAERAEFLRKAASHLRQRAEEYAQLMTREMGKLIDQARAETALAADILEYYSKNGEKFLQPKPVPEAPGTTILTQPIGVIMAVEPWNFPYYQLARVAGPQLVSGNVVIFKHASAVPACALAFARLFEHADTPEGVYTNLFCTPKQVNMLIDDYRVRGVTLTGSEKAGAAVAERAGRNLKKVVLELGGSDPFVVLPDADLENAAKQAVIGRMITTGQTCVCSKRFIVIGKERGQVFLDGMVKYMSRLQPGDPQDEKTSLGPLVAEDALTGLLSQIEQAKSHGARVVLGGKRVDRPGWYLEPTIITDITPENPLYYEETFGPIASFYVVDTEQEAIDLANATKFGLGGSVFGADVKHAHEVASKIYTGMVCVNCLPYTGPETPFGGVANSGYGRELGEMGMGEFVNHKTVRNAPGEGGWGLTL
ncbi:aldehyde dehydrogenase [Rhizodiscina lignyota]|uniref:Aldehyde dehydrogenase n=1 Tax=Rhizodiscina lignyota TaxID=1504668 RepID=A0A9P4M7P6_9PEZI|nr:aldehyde dehydrogenase [Rhizodiscina lignyota]